VQTPRTNVNSDTNVNVNNSTNYYGGDYGWGDGGAWGAAAVGAVTGAAVGAAVASSAPAYGTVVYAVPSGCAPVAVGGVTYQNCGGVYYQPSYQGSTLVYQVVPAP
jgi:hypothetical protein